MHALRSLPALRTAWELGVQLPLRRVAAAPTPELSWRVLTWHSCSPGMSAGELKSYGSTRGVATRVMSPGVSPRLACCGVAAESMSSPVLGPVPVLDKFLKNGDVDIHYVEAGPPQGPLVVLLHGFPSFWYTWKHQIGPLAQKGYHVVAPDLRGYNMSSRPDGVKAYGREPVLSDVTAVLDACGVKGGKATLIGHDWGGAIAWTYAQEHPERLSRLVVLNMPFPPSFSRALFTDPHQMRRSWYIFLFQLPSLGERMMAANDFHSLKHIVLEDPAQKQSEQHAQYHVEAFSQPGALTSAINYYRATLLHWGQLQGGRNTKVELPVLVLWGEKDYVFEPYLIDPPKDQVPNARVIRFPQATHWLMWDEPEVVNKHILEFLAEGSMDPQIKEKQKIDAKL